MLIHKFQGRFIEISVPTDWRLNKFVVLDLNGRTASYTGDLNVHI